MHSVSNLSEPPGTMVDGIHGRDVGKEGLGSADITGGLVFADVLFPRLETETVGGHIKKIPGGGAGGEEEWEGRRRQEGRKSGRGGRVGGVDGGRGWQGDFNTHASTSEPIVCLSGL